MRAAGETVFIVCDEPQRAAGLVDLFASVHLATRHFPSDEALLESLSPDTSGCIVADTASLTRDAAAFHAALRQAGIVLPVLHLGAGATVGGAVSALQAGAADFLEVPFNDQALLDSVATALDRAEHRRIRAAERAEAAAHFDTLTPRERAVLPAIVRGGSDRTIAREIGVSERTVETYRRRIIRKSGAGHLPGLIRMAIRAGLDQPG